ncbi:hypothetical protein ADM90_07845 [Lysinibacillus macroides]|uniref:Acyl-CoA dehydrogenase n=2 Tax=Lysinibacillus macroides TaxID=33935 RepID=A0A0N1J0A4_9BACI|nr:hypothetical protein ADM90_07845 [Lysinibacillus macroides]
MLFCMLAIGHVIEKIQAHAQQVDEMQSFPHENFRLLADEGLFGLHIAKRYGGSEQSFYVSAQAVEEVAKVCASTSVLLCTQALTTCLLDLGGNEEQKANYLRALVAGKYPGAFCVTEEQAGSDVSNIQTQAVYDDGSYILTGEKRFITNAGEAGAYLVLARTGEHPTRGLSFFIVEATAPGVEFGECIETLGVRGSSVGAVIFNKVRVPKENLLGIEGSGFKLLMKTFNRSRTLVGAQGVGIAKGAFQIALDYLKARNQFGKPLSEQPMIQGMLAELGTKIVAAELLVKTATEHIDEQTNEMEKHASMAKYYATDVAMQVTTDAVQLLGGNGFTTLYPLERMMRDAKVTQIYDGTNQIQRVIIARQLLK